LPDGRRVSLPDKAFGADERVIERVGTGKVGRDLAQEQPIKLNTLRRHLIQNFFCKLKQCRALATRYDKTARNFLVAIHLAAAIIRPQLRTGLNCLQY
jgi:hypothetical protein